MCRYVPLAVTDLVMFGVFVRCAGAERGSADPARTRTGQSSRERRTRPNNYPAARERRCRTWPVSLWSDVGWKDYRDEERPRRVTGAVLPATAPRLRKHHTRVCANTRMTVLLAAETGVGDEADLDAGRRRRIVDAPLHGIRDQCRAACLDHAVRLLRERCSRRASIGESRTGSKGQRAGHDGCSHAETDSESHDIPPQSGVGLSSVRATGSEPVDARSGAGRRAGASLTFDRKWNFGFSVPSKWR